jgi:hypothetical protein
LQITERDGTVSQWQVKTFEDSSHFMESMVGIVRHSYMLKRGPDGKGYSLGKRTCFMPASEIKPNRFPVCQNHGLCTVECRTGPPAGKSVSLF